jgi:hypothetical protein
MNILSTIRDQFSPELLGQVSQRVGENTEAAKSALENSVQALLGSAAAEASSPSGAANLFNLLKDKTPSGGWPSSISGMLSNLTGGAGGIGSLLVNSLLGSKSNMVRDFIANRAGIRSESAASLLGTAGSLLMGILGRQVASQSLSPSGFGQLLRSQIPHLQASLSPDMTSMLGLGNLLDPAKAANQAPSYAPVVQADDVSTREPVGAGRGWRWALVAIALLLGVFLISRFYNRQPSAGAALDDTVTTRGASPPATTPAALPRVDIAGLTDRLKTAIAGTDGSPVELQGVSFDNSGNLLPTAKDSLVALGNLLTAQPSLKLNLTAYGKTADEASSRANAIRSALVRLGIPAERIVTQSEIGDSSVPKVSFTK